MEASCCRGDRQSATLHRLCEGSGWPRRAARGEGLGLSTRLTAAHRRLGPCAHGFRLCADLGQPSQLRMERVRLGLRRERAEKAVDDGELERVEILEQFLLELNRRRGAFSE